MARKTLNARRIEAQIELEEAQARLTKLQNEAAARIGRIAIKTGLADRGLSDDEIKSEFEKIASRREQGEKS
ncbi:MAG: TraC family protein [Acidocella sp.]|nr:TraC family protein [Acidocella sp.]